MTNPTARGIAALEKANWEEAELSFTEALEQNPRDLEANIGMARMALHAGYPEDVHGFITMPEAKDPRLGDLEYTALRVQGKTDEAFGRAIEVLSTLPEASGFRVRVGSDLLAADRHVEALEVFREGASIDPSNHLMAGGEGAACQMLGRMEECRSAVERRLRLLPDDPIVFSQWFALHVGKPSASAASLLAMGREWDRRFAGDRERPGKKLPSQRVTGSHEKLRVGFVSSTFRHHANCQFLLPLLEALDHDRLEVFAYHDGSHTDNVTDRCRVAVNMFRSIHGMSEAKAVQRIREDRIDVLIDINAHFDDARMRLFAYRAAPFQVHYLGGGSTTGLRCMDWRLADDLNEPPGENEEEIGTERIFRMEGGIHSFRPLRATAPPGPLPMSENGFVTFGCLNSLTKMEDPVLRLWARCLDSVPDSRLRLIKQAFRHEANRGDFSERAARLGIDPARLDLLAGEVPAFDDLSVYHGIDIALDTFPYNGITTTCEALWMGVPVVTLAGDRFVAREAAGIVTRCGHPEWVASTPEEYIEKVRSLSSDPLGLAGIRLNLRTDFQQSPLHDPSRLAGEMHQFLSGLFPANT